MYITHNENDCYYLIAIKGSIFSYYICARSIVLIDFNLYVIHYRWKILLLVFRHIIHHMKAYNFLYHLLFSKY